MSNITIGSKVWHCYFYAHDISQFQIKNAFVDKINNCQYDSSPWAYDSKGELIGRLNQLSLSKDGAISHLQSSLIKRQDELKKDNEKERQRLYNLIDDNDNRWLSRDSEINNKISYLMHKAIPKKRG
jgi:hypothetical protein